MSAASTLDPSQVALAVAASGAPDQTEPDIVVAADPQRVADMRSLTDTEFARQSQMEQWLESLPDRAAKPKDATQRTGGPIARGCVEIAG